MIIDDTEDALESRQLHAIEAAFQVLVQWSEHKPAESGEDPAELARLLDRVTAALEADRNAMPDDLVDSIMRESRDGGWLEDDRSYAAGARAVAAKSVHWKRLFEASTVPRSLVSSTSVSGEAKDP